jgi:hypothetical protein
MFCQAKPFPFPGAALFHFRQDFLHPARKTLSESFIFVQAAKFLQLMPASVKFSACTNGL